jgi:ATP synthase protein I
MAGDAREQDDDGPRSTNETVLSERLTRLGERLDATGASRQPGADPGNRATLDPSALARGLRLSSEFVAGVLAGAGLGWLVDHWLKTSPWGLIGLTLLGFVASVVNLVRASSAGAGDLPNRRADRRQD